MEKVKYLLQDFLREKIPASVFVVLFLELVRNLKNHTDKIVDEKPELVKQSRDLLHRKAESAIANNEYHKIRLKLNQEFGGQYIPYSMEQQILDHLWVEADTFYENPLDREVYQIGETELRNVVRESLDKLMSLET